MAKKLKSRSAASREKELKREYKLFIVDSNLKRIRMGCFFGFSLVPAGAAFDYFIYPDKFSFFLIIRSIFSLVFLATYISSFTSFVRNHTTGMMIFVAVSIAIPIDIMIQYTGGYASPYYAGLILIILGVCVLFIDPIQALIGCSLIYLTYLIPIYFFNEINDFNVFLNNNYFLSFTIIIAVVTNYFTSKLRFSDFKNRFRLNVAVSKLIDKSKELIRARRLERKMELYRRLASIGEIASGVAHELNNALNASISSVRHLGEISENLHEVEELPEFFKEAKDDVRILSNGMTRAHSVVKNLLTFSKKDAEGFKYQDIHEGIESTIDILGSQLRNRIIIHKELAESGEMYCDLNQLNQVFFNLLKNASDAIAEEKGEIWIKTKVEGSHLIVSIRDNGPGISADVMDRIFDPFFSTKGVGKGTGLGLSVSYNIIKNHHGKIECSSQVGEGAEFIITLPLDASKEIEKDEYRKAV